MTLLVGVRWCITPGCYKYKRLDVESNPYWWEQVWMAATGRKGCAKKSVLTNRSRLRKWPS